MRELHDELGQALTALEMDVLAIGSELSPPQVAAINRTSDMARLLENTVVAVRRIATQPCPLMLDDFGLIATLGWLANDFAKRTGIDVNSNVSERLPEPMRAQTKNVMHAAYKLPEREGMARLRQQAKWLQAQHY